jgi:hypothetical protein
VVASVGPRLAHVGAIAAAAWLTERDAPARTLARWNVEIALDVHEGPARVEYDERVASRFHLDIYAEEWGFFFCHGGRASWIRVTDVPFVHGRDEFGLLDATPSLRDVGTLLRDFERRNGVRFHRDQALVRTTVPDAEARIRAWIRAL